MTFLWVAPGGTSEAFTINKLSAPEKKSSKVSAISKVSEVSPKIVAETYDSTYRKLPRNNTPPPRIVAKVENLMTSPVVTISVEKNYREAQEALVIGKFRHLPVIGRDRSIQGIISERDLLRAAATKTYNENLGITTEEFLADYSVRFLLRSPVLTATPDSSIREAAEVMYAARVGCLPVVKSTQLVGIITRSDILKALVNEAPIEIWV